MLPLHLPSEGGISSINEITDYYDRICFSRTRLKGTIHNVTFPLKQWRRVRSCDDKLGMHREATRGESFIFGFARITAGDLSRVTSSRTTKCDHINDECEQAVTQSCNSTMCNLTKHLRFNARAGIRVAHLAHREIISAMRSSIIEFLPNFR